MAQASSYPNVTGKVALVSGGSTGIGRAAALLFGRHGVKVVIGDLNSAGRETVEMIEREGGSALFVETNVCSAQQIQELVAAAVETYGGLHFAFNNAGILPAAALLADVDEVAFDHVMAVDVKGVFLAMKYEIQYMLTAGSGVIVNNASSPE